MNDDWATIRARRVLGKLSDGAAMNERVEEIRRKFYTTFPNPDVLTGETATAIRDLLAALAQAEAENERLRERLLVKDGEWLAEHACAEQEAARVAALEEALRGAMKKLQRYGEQTEDESAALARPAPTPQGEQG